MEYSWITHSNLFAGSKVDICGRVSTFTFKNMIGYNPEPSKNPAETYDNRLTTVDYVGHENPVWSIQGFIGSSTGSNATETHLNSVGSMEMDVHRLGSFAMLGSPVWFYDDEKNLWNPAGSVQIWIETVGMTRNATRDGKDYNITIRETKQWS